MMPLSVSRLVPSALWSAEWLRQEFRVSMATKLSLKWPSWDVPSFAQQHQQRLCAA